MLISVRFLLFRYTLKINLYCCKNNLMFLDIQFLLNVIYSNIDLHLHVKEERENDQNGDGKTVCGKI